MTRADATTRTPQNTLKEFWSRLAPWVEGCLAFVYPHWCQICQAERATPENGFLCQTCRKEVAYVSKPHCERCGLPFPGDLTHSFECSNCQDRELAFEWARAAVIAKGVPLEVIHRYKYQRALWFEPFLADLLVQAAAPHLDSNHWDFLVPVPLHPLKLREREFNQAERLARRLGRATGIPVAPYWVQRIEPTTTQTHLSRDERVLNVGHAFAPVPKTRLKGQRCIIIDDVLTTGATTNAVAKTLRNLGSGPVGVWSVARAVFQPPLIAPRSKSV